MSALTTKMILHRTMTEPLGPIEAQMMEYIWAGNGVFVRAKRTGLAGCIRLADFETPGLPDAPELECARMDYPQVPVDLMATMFDLAWKAGSKPNRRKEIMFRFWWEEKAGQWRLDVPKQEQSWVFCKPLSREPRNTMIEIHSHHAMPAYFSSQDDKDEQGFRLYGVIGGFLETPDIRLRMGIFGHYLEIQPAKYLQLPEGLRELEYAAAVVEDAET